MLDLVKAKEAVYGLKKSKCDSDLSHRATTDNGFTDRNNGLLYR